MCEYAPASFHYLTIELCGYSDCLCGFSQGLPLLLSQYLSTFAECLLTTHSLSSFVQSLLALRALLMHLGLRNISTESQSNYVRVSHNKWSSITKEVLMVALATKHIRLIVAFRVEHGFR